MTTKGEKLTIRLGPLRLAAKLRRVSGLYGSLALTSQEFGLLWLLASHAGEVITKEQILKHLYDWEYKFKADQKIIDVLICKIRKKIAPAVGFQPVKTAYGRGYYIPKDGGERQEAA